MPEPATQASDLQILTEWAGIPSVVPRPSAAFRYQPFTRFQEALAAAVAAAVGPLQVQLNQIKAELDCIKKQAKTTHESLMVLDKRHLEQCQGT